MIEKSEENTNKSNTTFSKEVIDLWNPSDLEVAKFERILTPKWKNKWAESKIIHGERILDGIPFKNKWKVLEIGCGIGRLVSEFSKTFDFVEGVDFSESMIAFTNEYLKDYENCRVHLNNGVDLSNLHSNEYDFVYSMITFQHIDSKQVIESYIREIHRVLKKSGYIKLQFMTPSLNSMKDWGTRRGYDFTSNEELLELFSEFNVELEIDSTQKKWVWVRGQV